MGPVRPMRMSHHNGSVGTAAAKVSVNRGIGQYIKVFNTHATQTLSVSFNGGKDYFDLDPNVARILELNALFHWVVLVGSGADTTYQILIGEG